MRVVNKIIINADDFGYSDAVNGAVLRSFQRFLVTSTSLLVNMPGFENAVSLLQEHAVLSKAVGVRLNFSDGFSLTGAVRSCKKICHGSGFFMLNGHHRLLALNGREKGALYAEMKAQLEKALMAGVRPTHLDMNHSLHAQWPVAVLLAKLGQEYGIPRMRFFHNLGPKISRVDVLYRLWFNRLLWRYMGVVGPDHSGEVDDLLQLPDKRRPVGKTIEIAIHAAIDEYGELCDRSGKGLQLKLRPVIDHRHTMSYAGLPVPAGRARMDPGRGRGVLPELVHNR